MPSRNSRPRTYICPQCNKDFCTSSKLRTHSYTHSGVRPFSCFVCNVSFNQKPNLKRHLRVQHEFEDSKINELINQTHQIRCIEPECQITFQKDNDLKRHLRMDHFLEESQIEEVLIENYIVHPVPILWKWASKYIFKSHICLNLTLVINKLGLSAWCPPWMCSQLVL